MKNSIVTPVLAETVVDVEQIGKRAPGAAIEAAKMHGLQMQIADARGPVDMWLARQEASMTRVLMAS